MATVTQQRFDWPQALCTVAQSLQCTLAIVHMGCCHSDRMRQALSVNCNITLDARNLLACVMALLRRCLRVLHALCIHDQEGGCMRCSPVSCGSRQLDFFQSLRQQADALLIEPTSLGKVRMHRLPFWKVAGPGPPLAAVAQQVRNRAEHLIQNHAARLGAFACLLQNWKDLLESLTADVAVRYVLWRISSVCTHQKIVSML